MISRWILKSEKCFRLTSIKSKYTFYVQKFLFWKSCSLWDNVEKYCGGRQAIVDSIKRRMRFAWWITKATNTVTECVILIAFPRQQWLRERAIMLRYTYVACLARNVHIFGIKAYTSVCTLPSYNWSMRTSHCWRIFYQNYVCMYSWVLRSAGEVAVPGYLAGV